MLWPSPVVDVCFVLFVFQAAEPPFEVNIGHFITEHRCVHHWNVTAIPNDDAEKVSAKQRLYCITLLSLMLSGSGR